MTLVKMRTVFIVAFLGSLTSAQERPFGITRLLEAVNSSSANLTKCSADVLQVFRSLKNKEMWALKMLDAGSKIPSGFLYGHFSDLGQYDECTSITSKETNHSFDGLYCLVSIPMGKSIPIPLSLGGCFPSSCKAEELEQATNSAIQRAKTYIKALKQLPNVTINPNDCHTHAKEPLRIEEWVVLCIILFFTLVIVVATLIDIGKGLRLKKETTVMERTIVSFSALANGSKILNMDQKEGQMTAINGIKFFSMCWVILGHRYAYLIQQPLMNLGILPSEFTRWQKLILLSGPLSVDSFFLIGGLLNMYTFSKIMELKKTYNVGDVLMTYVHRYIRLTPAYAMMMAFTGTLLFRLGDGPYWYRMVWPEVEKCQKYFYWNLLYISNYHEMNYCMMQTWYLSADMQMFWLSPLVVYPLWRWPKLGSAFVTLLTGTFIVIPFMVSYIYKIKAPLPFQDMDSAATVMFKFYLPTHVKAVSYVMGIGFGAIVYRLHTGKWKLNLNKWATAAIWLGSAIVMLYAIYGAYWLFQPTHPYNKWESAFYIGFFRFFWSLGLGWILIACVSGQGGFINSFLSWELFAPLGRLSYAVYLTHIVVILTRLGSTRVPYYYSDYEEVHGFVSDLITILFASMFVTLVFEAPLIGLEKIIFGKAMKREPSKAEADPEEGQKGDNPSNTDQNEHTKL